MRRGGKSIEMRRRGKRRCEENQFKKEENRGVEKSKSRKLVGQKKHRLTLSNHSSREAKIGVMQSL